MPTSDRSPDSATDHEAAIREALYVLDGGHADQQLSVALDSLDALVGLLQQAERQAEQDAKIILKRGQEIDRQVARAERAEQGLDLAEKQMTVWAVEADIKVNRAEARVRVLEEALREARSFIRANTTPVNAGANETLLHLDRALAPGAAPPEPPLAQDSALDALREGRLKPVPLSRGAAPPEPHDNGESPADDPESGFDQGYTPLTSPAATPPNDDE